MLKKNRIIVIAVLLSLVACTQNEVYFNYQSVQIDGWNKDSVCVFDVKIDDASKAYNIYVNTRNRGEYPYQNLWLFVNRMASDSVQVNDTINFYLADEFGKWLGDGVGSVYNMPVLYQQSIRFPAAGTYKYKIQHGMRDSLLQGINDIGLKVEIAE
ncbi:MAG: gliding motility lipoprotein GldH [Paludibacter sp.]|nr:gliding motility lipoprotein GldH [Paludibacter sp.]